MNDLGASPPGGSPYEWTGRLSYEEALANPDYLRELRSHSIELALNLETGETEIYDIVLARIGMIGVMLNGPILHSNDGPWPRTLGQVLEVGSANEEEPLSVYEVEVEGKTVLVNLFPDHFDLVSGDIVKTVKSSRSDTSREAQMLLIFLLEHQGQAFSTRTLKDSLWAGSGLVKDVVDSHFYNALHFLQQKMGAMKIIEEERMSSGWAKWYGIGFRSKLKEPKPEPEAAKLTEVDPIRLSQLMGLRVSRKEAELLGCFFATDSLLADVDDLVTSGSLSTRSEHGIRILVNQINLKAEMQELDIRLKVSTTEQGSTVGVIL